MKTPPQGGRTFLRMENVNASLGGRTGLPPQSQVKFPVKKRQARPPKNLHY